MSSSDIERDVGKGLSMRLTALATQGRVARRGERGHYRYFPMGPKDPDAPARSPKVNANTPGKAQAKQGGSRARSPNNFRKSKLAVQAEAAKSKPGPKWKQRGDEPPAVRTKLRALVKAAGNMGVTSTQIGDTHGRNGLTTAGHLVRIGEWRREGYGPGSRYFFVRDPIEGQEHKRHGPRALSNDELDQAVERVRKARADLEAAAEHLASVASRYGRVSSS